METDTTRADTRDACSLILDTVARLEDLETCLAVGGKRAFSADFLREAADQLDELLR